MIVISYGIRKSGSTFAFELAKTVLELAGYSQVLLPEALLAPANNGTRGRRINAAGPWTDDLLAQVIEAGQGTKTVVRTHANPRRLSSTRVVDALDAGELKIHVVFRDPRDTVLSLFDEARDKPEKNKARTVDDAIDRLRPRIRSLWHWGSYPSLKLLYDDFAFDPVTGPQLIADDLGVTIDPHEVWRIVSSRRTRKNVAQPRRYTTEMSATDAARIAAAFPGYTQMVEQRDFGWFSYER